MQVLLLISVILSIVNVRRGLGKHIYAIPPENLADIGLVSTLDGTFSILAASLSKTAFAVTLLRILKDRTRYVVWFIIATINITMGLSALFGWVRCAPVEKVWRVTLPGTCWPPEGESAESVLNRDNLQLIGLDSTSVLQLRHGIRR